MPKDRILWSGYPWLLSALLIIAVVLQGVALQQAQQEIKRLRRREHQALEAVEQLRQGQEEAAELAEQLVEREQRQGRHSGPVYISPTRTTGLMMTQNWQRFAARSKGREDSYFESCRPV